MSPNHVLQQNFLLSFLSESHDAPVHRTTVAHHFEGATNDDRLLKSHTNHCRRWYRHLDRAIVWHDRTNQRLNSHRWIFAAKHFLEKGKIRSPINAIFSTNQSIISSTRFSKILASITYDYCTYLVVYLCSCSYPFGYMWICLVLSDIRPL